MKLFRITYTLFILILLVSCSSPAPQPQASMRPRVLAAESFLADITQNIAGDRLKVETLIPPGTDPHSYQPTPADVTKISRSQVLVVNGGGLEEFLEDILENASSDGIVIEASAGLEPRDSEASGKHDHAIDPHFWLDPNNVIAYVENIRRGLIQADPEGEPSYNQNAEEYTAQLNKLDAWIREQVETIPVQDRLLVTDHESFGYFADRYGFQIVGAIVPSVSSGASLSAKELAGLIDRIRASGAKAIFLESGANARLAEEIAAETGAEIAPPLATHSPLEENGSTGGYIEMMQYNTNVIVTALSGSQAGRLTENWYGK